MSPPSSSSSSSSSRLSFSLLSAASLIVLLVVAASQFAVIVGQSTGPELRSGLSQSFRISAGGWSYFTFTNTIADADVVVGLTAFAGNPDIFFNQGDNGACITPTLSNHTAKDDGEGGGVLAAYGVPQGAKFCIGVYAEGGWEADGRVLVVASGNQATLNPTQLQNGEPTNDVLRSGQVSLLHLPCPRSPPRSLCPFLSRSLATLVATSTCTSTVR